jgi:acyl dehydratase
MELIFEDINIGDEVIDLLKPPITKVQLVRYAGASGDFNPLHTDEEAARVAGFDGVVAQGMLVMGMVAQAVTDWVPKRALKKFKVRFRGATRPGDIIRVLGKVTDKRVEDKKGIVVCTLEAADQNNDIKILGSFETAFPI